MKNKVDTHTEIFDKIKSRLNQVGIITTAELWQKCPHHYTVVATVVRNVMGIMIHKGYAKKIRNGKWEILVENKCW